MHGLMRQIRQLLLYIRACYKLPRAAHAICPKQEQAAFLRPGLGPAGVHTKRSETPRNHTVNLFPVLILFDAQAY